MKRAKFKIGLLLMLMVTAINAVSAKQLLIQNEINPKSTTIEVSPERDRDFFFWV